MMRHLPARLSAALVLAVVRPAAAQPASAAAPVPGTYLCWSTRIAELLAEDARQAQAASGPRVLPERIVDQVAGGNAPLKYLIRAGGTFADVSGGDRYAADPRYNGQYAVQNGLVRLTQGGMTVFLFRRARSAQGSELLVQVREGPPNPYASTQLCRRTEGTTAAAPRPPAVAAPAAPSPQRPAPAPVPQTPTAVSSLVRGHPNDGFSYPGSVMLVWNDYARTPTDAVVEVTFTPIDGANAPFTVQRSVAALRSSPAMDDSRPLDQTYRLPVLAPGSYRVRATLSGSGVAPRALDLRIGTAPQAREVELRWAPAERYREGGGKILDLIADPPR